MTAQSSRPEGRKVANSRRFRVDAPARTEAYPESCILRLWLASQAAKHQDLLLTVAAARNARRDG